MADYLIQESTLDSIVRAINDKAGTQVAMTPAQMVTAIGSIQTGGTDSRLVGILSGTLNSINIPELTSIRSNAFNSYSASNSIVVLTNVGSISQNCFRNANVITLDVTQCSYIADNGINAAQVQTLILRKSDALVTAANAQAINSARHMTVYIPKVLYDHLGDGTNLDYKAATNWSAKDSAGTVTWAQIEGSIYETQYADGTLIPST